MRSIAIYLLAGLLLVPLSVSSSVASPENPCTHDENPKLCASLEAPGTPIPVLRVLTPPPEGLPTQATTEASPHEGENETRIPCADQAGQIKGCPDLTVDPTHFSPTVGWENFDPKHCAVEEGLVDPGERRLLRLTFTSPNFGDGNLILGAPADHPEWYEFSECHEHYHLLGFAEYRLWTLEGYAAWQSERTQRENETAEEVLDEHPELRDDFIVGHKQAFCLIDVTFYVPIPRTYFDCEEKQGLTVGWGDTYVSSLDGQWIDITGVEAGWYVLEAEVNPEHRIVETDYEDNSGAVLVEIPAN